MKLISNILSYILHPIFIPLYAILLYTQIGHNITINLRTISYESYIKLAISPIFLFTIIFPLFSIFIMYNSKIISSFKLENRQERIPILFLSCIYYGVTYYFIRSLDIAYYHSFFGLFISFLIGILLLSLFSLIITSRFKISLHCIGIGALAGGFLGFTQELQPMINMDTFIIINTFLIALVGLVATSRLILNSHSINQVLTGCLLGFFTEYIIVSNHLWW